MADGYTMNRGGKKNDIIPKYKLLNQKKKGIDLKLKEYDIINEKTLEKRKAIEI